MPGDCLVDPFIEERPLGEWLVPKNRKNPFGMAAKILSKFDRRIHLVLGYHGCRRILVMFQAVEDEREPGDLGWHLRRDPASEPLCCGDHLLIPAMPGNPGVFGPWRKFDGIRRLVVAAMVERIEEIHEG
jgi:hypothetical protein